jgi:LAO/AO transport system kinase
VSAKSRGKAASSAVTAESVRAGSRRALARAITLIESTRTDHRVQSEALLRQLLPFAGHAIRLGVSGVPGVGKSTFIEALGLHLIAQGHRLAVLAVDPSSPISGGSILGDKTRMARLAAHADAFIRPSPAKGSLGGVARHTREAMIACEAAGFDVIIVETIGVGQSETAVGDMVDLFLLLLAPGGGDELQGIKKGIVEIADLLVVNKADGDLAPAAERARRDYASALHVLAPLSAAAAAPVMKCSALEGTGIGEVWAMVERLHRARETSGALARRRAAQARAWMWSEVSETLLGRLMAHPGVAARIAEWEGKIAAGEASPGEATQAILKAFKP